MEREPITRKELIKQAIAWKMSNPSNMRLTINRREVLSPKEVGMMLSPDDYNLPK